MASVTVSVDLDASRRWVTIRGVHDEFADALAGHNSGVAHT